MKSENYELIVNALRQNAGKTPLSAQNPRLIAVSKGQPWEKINDLWDRGQRVFGENRWQEAFARWSEVRSQKSELELHFIGPLQTNKVPEVVNFFDCIHSVDRPKLADALAKEGCTLP